MYTGVQGTYKYMYVDGSLCTCVVYWSVCFPPTLSYLLSFAISDLPLKWPSAPMNGVIPSRERHESASLSDIWLVPGRVLVLF